jgi:NADH-quinone oxidoreductase subunit L
METNLLHWIILFPIFGAIANAGFYFYHIKVQQIPEYIFSIFGTVTPFLSFVATAFLYFDYVQAGEPLHQHIVTWLSVDMLTIQVDFLADSLSIFMALFVTFVGWLIHIYAIGYMTGDEGFGKFFAYFNLFLASMLILVLANNPIILFIGWEGVGVCSYLLISFYYKEKENVIAGNKAFIVNRVGDFGFLLGVVTLFFALGESAIDFASMEKNIHTVDPTLLTLSGILLFVGAMGKSAQIPLYTWLPDAMAGPTPISALIHAATMVTAGVYMVARFNFLYLEIPDVGLFIAYIGAFSTLLAAVIATKQTDIKKILAYSTMSQLGYMFIAVGLGFYSSGLFHVFTHAFFKAMLFMGAGAMIIAMHHEQDIFKMAKHRKQMPIVQYTMLIGIIAISGIPPFSGFFSKDAILAASFAQGEYLIWGIGMLTAFLTPFYMFRIYFVLFVAPTGTPTRDYYEAPKSIAIPLFLLAIGAIFAGFFNVPEALHGEHLVDTWLVSINSLPLHMSHSTEYILMVVSVVVAVFGIYVSYKKYGKFDLSKRDVETGMVYNKFYVDEIYHALFVIPTQKISVFIDKVTDGKIIDGFIMGVSRQFVDFGKNAEIFQSANVRIYALMMLCAISIISLVLYKDLLGM